MLVSCLAAAAAPARAAEATEAATCVDHLQRQLKRNLNREFADFRPAADVVAREAKPRGKFTPRHPVDVDRILRIDGEGRVAKKSDKASRGKTAAAAVDHEPDFWVEAEAWCGYRAGRLIASDLVKR